jgi:hypothetical protein
MITLQIFDTDCLHV